MPISSDVKLLVRPPKSKHQKPGLPAANKEASYQKEAVRPFTKKPVKQPNKMRTSCVKFPPDDDDDNDENDVWDDGLLPKHVHGNGRHSDSGVVNGMRALDIVDTDSGSLREMFVSEVRLNDSVAIEFTLVHTDTCMYGVRTHTRTHSTHTM